MRSLPGRMPTASQITQSASSARHVFLISLSSRLRSLFQLARAPSFLTMLCCQVLLLCAALSWTLWRSFSSLTVSPQPRHKAVDCAFSLFDVLTLLNCCLTAVQFHPLRGQAGNRKTGLKSWYRVKRGSYCSAHSDFGQDRLGLSQMFSFILFFFKENPEIWMLVWKILFVSEKWIHTL